MSGWLNCAVSNSAHPEEATEGMNRVAQAFICLTEALVRSSGGNGTTCKDNAATADTQQIVAAGTKTAIDWQHAPPPVRLDRAAAANEVPSSEPAPASKRTDNASPLGQPSTEARRGLGTLPALIERINLTRRMILTWNQAGKYLSDPKKKLSRSTEEIDLSRRLNKVFALTDDFPKIIGNPGQPGYRVVAMARLEMTALMFKSMDKSQRKCLARDWEAGYRVLIAYRRFLRGQFKALRRRGLVPLVLQAIRGALNDHPIWVSLGVVATIAICVAFYGRFF